MLAASGNRTHLVAYKIQGAAKNAILDVGYNGCSSLILSGRAVELHDEHSYKKHRCENLKKNIKHMFLSDIKTL